MEKFTDREGGQYKRTRDIVINTFLWYFDASTNIVSAVIYNIHLYCIQYIQYIVYTVIFAPAIDQYSIM